MTISRAQSVFVAWVAVLFAGLLMAAGPCLADGKRLNQDQVLEAVKNGEIKAFTDVLAVAEQVWPGRVVRVEVERVRGRVVYEFKIIGANGRVREIYIDAATLEVVKAR